MITNKMDQEIGTDVETDNNKDLEALVCEGGHKAVKICFTSKCQHSKLICGKGKECPACQVHKNCGTFQIHRVLTPLKLRRRIQRTFELQLKNIDNFIVDKILQNQDKTKRVYYLLDLQLKDREIIRQLTDKNALINVKGEQIDAFLQRLEKSSNHIDDHSQKLIATYREEMQKKYQEILSLSRHFLEELTDLHEMVAQEQLKPVDFKWESAILKPPTDNNRAEMQRYNKYTAFLIEILSNPKTLRPLFRGTSDGFAVKTFKEKCKDVKNTLTLVKTESGKIIGGYSKLPLAVSGDSKIVECVKDSEKKAFLFSLTLEKKMSPLNDSSIVRHPEWGPCFGGDRGCDLRIKDQNDNSAYFPTNFNFQGGPQKRSQKSYTEFSGATDGDSFKIQDYEVFQVIYE